MVRIVGTDNKKTYFCEHCGEDFTYFGMAENHELYECSPEKGKENQELKHIQKKLNEGERFQQIYSILKNNELEEGASLVNQYKKEIDELQNRSKLLGSKISAAMLYDIRQNVDQLLANVRILNLQLTQRNEALRRERALDFETAIQIWEELDEIDEAARVRKTMTEQGAVKVNQKVVHGDEISKTEIKDSVLNKSNVGRGEGEDKFTKLKELKEMYDSGFISQEEMEKMKLEIMN
jgi:hypothetical protein|tara:strand:+ start:223 stop:930 length:708 start_codon:yes stop_codon:yes gene_type:complete